MAVDTNLLNFLNEEMPLLLQQLKPDATPQWGIMSAQHMIEHLGGSFYIGTGKIPIKAMYDQQRTQQSYNHIIKNRQPFSKGVRVNIVPAEPAPLRFDSLAIAIEKMLGARALFFAYFKENPEATLPHPAFGQLNYEDWIVFEAQHIKHHFLQFGLIDSY